MIKKILTILFYICSATSLSCRTLPQFTKNTELTFIDTLTIYSEAKALFVTRLAAVKLFEINGHCYDYDTIFTGKPREIHWIDNTQRGFPRGFLYDLDKDDAPLIEPIGYNKNFMQ